MTIALSLGIVLKKTFIFNKVYFDKKNKYYISLLLIQFDHWNILKFFLQQQYYYLLK